MMAFNGYGSYLVRESENRPGEYSLSIRDTERVRHYRIMHLDKGGYFVTMYATFVTIQDLVAYHQQQADGLCTNLTKPCALSKKPQTADLSRQVYDEWEIDRWQIKLFGKLISNEFVEVWRGMWNGITPIFVKTPRPGKIPISDFLQTINLMRKIRHQNIVQLYAVCTKEEPVFIVTEFMKHNSLLEYLRGEGRSLKLPQLIDMASQVAAGMAYLEEQNIVHKDLVARSILVGEHLKCKVANFELARKASEGIYEAEAGTDRYAVKWAAPEVLLQNRFSIKSDVWSFGIVLYETVTYGHPPYTGMSNDQSVVALEQSYRMPQPPGCPDWLYKIMLDCWQEEPEKRPTFETLQLLLEKFFTTEDAW